MPFRPSTNDLSDTIARRWRTKLMGSAAKPRSHWRTKVSYYRAATEVLAHGCPFTWRDVVAARRPRGSASTFYEVAGPSARHGLIDAYYQAGDGISLQIAYEYHRTGALDHLIDEAKVWSFWEYREAYLRTHRDSNRLPLAAYVEALAAWASVHRPLAAALNFAPPVCAVEDLVALHPGGLAPMRARRLLTEVVREAVRRPEPPDPTDPSGLDALTGRTPAHDPTRHDPASASGSSVEAGGAADPVRPRDPAGPRAPLPA